MDALTYSAKRADLIRDAHRITYTGGEVTGYSWTCSCGATSSPPWADPFDRRWDAHDHLRPFGAQPRSCRGCCYEENLYDAEHPLTTCALCGQVVRGDRAEVQWKVEVGGGLFQDLARGTFWFHPECRTKMFHPASGLSIAPPRPSITIDPIVREEPHA